MAIELLSPRSRSQGILFSIPEEMSIKIKAGTRTVFLSCSSLQEKNEKLKKLFDEKAKLQGTYTLFLSDKYPTLLLGRAEGLGNDVEEKTENALFLAMQLHEFFQSCSFTKDGIARRSGPNVLFSVKGSEDKKRVVQEMVQRLELCTLEKESEKAAGAIGDMLCNCTIM